MNIAIELTKLAGGLFIGGGVGAVVTNLIQVTTPKDVGKITKAAIYVGSIVVAGLASKAASDQLDEKIDTVVNVTKMAVEKIKEIRNKKRGTY